jgi:hypothetical protein
VLTAPAASYAKKPRETKVPTTGIALLPFKAKLATANPAVAAVLAAPEAEGFKRVLPAFESETRP